MPKPHGHTSHCDCDACRNVPVFEDDIGKPTEGPFEVLPEGCSIVVSGGSNNDDLAEFFYADESTVKTTRAQALANAHLFKAAPMLLAALEGLVEEWEPEESDPFWDAARAAIKVARGFE